MKKERIFVNLGILAFAIGLCVALFFWGKQKPEPTEIYPHTERVDSTLTIVERELAIIPYDTVYEQAIAYLKEYESFRAVPYRDVNGEWTIGYGHQMIDSYWKWKDTISESAADSLLRSDLNKYIGKVAVMYEMNEYRTLAIALFNFNCGSGAYKGSTLRKLVETDQPIDDEIVKWCHCKIDGETVQHEKLKARRMFELKIYNYGMGIVQEK